MDPNKIWTTTLFYTPLHRGGSAFQVNLCCFLAKARSGANCSSFPTRVCMWLLSWGCPTLEQLALELGFGPGNNIAPLGGQSSLNAGMYMWCSEAYWGGGRRGYAALLAPYSNLPPNTNFLEATKTEVLGTEPVFVYFYLCIYFICPFIPPSLLTQAQGGSQQ